MSDFYFHQHQLDGEPCNCSAEYIENTYFGSIQHIAYWPREREARRLLEQVAARVRPVMKKKGWTRVLRLAEFYPADSRNYWGGTHTTTSNKERQALPGGFDTRCQIFVRLRQDDDRNRFLPEDDITDTLLHELCHCVHNHHAGKFLRLFQEVKSLYVALEGEIYAAYPTEQSFADRGYQVHVPHYRGGRGQLDAPRYRAGNAPNHGAAPSRPSLSSVFSELTLNSSSDSSSAPSECETDWGRGPPRYEARYELPQGSSRRDRSPSRLLEPPRGDSRRDRFSPRLHEPPPGWRGSHRYESPGNSSRGDRSRRPGFGLDLGSGSHRDDRSRTGFERDLGSPRSQERQNFNSDNPFLQTNPSVDENCHVQ